MGNKLSGKVAVVTGGNRGIGRAIAERLAAEEAVVVVGDVSGEPTTSKSSASELIFLQLDVTNQESVRSFVDKVLQRFGKIDILVNNAGIVVHKSIDEQTVEDWDRMMAVNLRGPFLMAKYVAPEMRRTGSGAIVNIGSVEAFMVNPWHTAYAASKAGVHGLTLGLAVDLGPDGIRCNTVCPGWIDTDLNRAYVEMHPDRSLIERELGQLHPVGRIGCPKEVANAVLWLASEESSFVSGEMIAVDGARTRKISLPPILDEEYRAKLSKLTV
ncbi:3-oxoacyl-ACP reductase family protein [Mesorhizobium sp. NZP2077]|uniref:SDR family NAD(P)-dependent oxidoreductase n=1 Tax=Mesorhizobium sp. NZP2077 TaxID=2483404 RepID=UPI001552882B|nr:3-oxoacyl-ACP reductase family protein [Mesorhizobium sp. NZP2077]QKC86903.1 3-oxoacyl-ACP reductase FabG [Mesorhizobium sp. NZP2077]QKD20603.1 3-oxoacyl-ACP reductase FabG [Mesorhizobium sp. NZP2077]